MQVQTSITTGTPAGSSSEDPKDHHPRPVQLKPLSRAFPNQFPHGNNSRKRKWIEDEEEQKSSFTLLKEKYKYESEAS